MRKKLLLVFAATFLLLLATRGLALAGVPAIESNPSIEVYINGVHVPRENLKPILIGDTTYIPAQALGLLRNVIVQENEKGAALAIEVPQSKYGYYPICLITGNDEAGPPPAGFKWNGKIYVPLRRWAEFFGATVTYEDGKIYVQQ